MTEKEMLVLPVRDTFPSFPYSPPYSIQTDLMRHVYAAIEQRRVAIIESPTGTGKTLSLLCSTLTWLADDKDRTRLGTLQALRDKLTCDDEPEWVLDQTLARHRREREDAERDMEERLERARRNEEKLRRMSRARVRKKQRLEEKGDSDDVVNEADFLPDDEDSNGDGLSPAVSALMESFEESWTRDVAVDHEEPICTKVYYTSRTHSQLSQLRSELLKIANTTSRVVPLASRKNLCINEELRAKGDNSANLDEGCRELLREKKGKRCPYLPPVGEEYKTLDFRDYVLATPKDIEDLVSIGRELHICPYFGSRRAIPQAELVTLPYNLLLQKSAREALGIDLTNHIVVIDEAHNLIDTILSIHTTTLSSSSLAASIEQLSIYLARFRSRLTPIHGLYLRRLLRFLHALAKFLAKWRAVSAKSEEIMQANELLASLGAQVEGINLLEIERYLKRSKIARKINMYNDKAGRKPAFEQGKLSHNASPPLHAVEAFMLALSNGDADGKLVLSRSEDPKTDTVFLKYQLLNPSKHFKDVVESARSVILAGGTMSPIEDFQLQLFPFLKEGQLSVFSCGHVIPRGNLQTIVISKGPNGGGLQFKYDTRGDLKMLTELGQLLSNFVNVIPHGIVVFFPSYAFLSLAKIAFHKNGLLEKLNTKKKVFFEPESTAEVDDILRQYALTISSENTNVVGKKGGALLFAVVGAKLSEGINFTDSLARAVIIVGLPYPSLASVELKERMHYVRELQKTFGNARMLGAKDAGSELYENLCMKNVNQSIGRAIRHKNDYACLLLVDRRYAGSHITNKLPQWIGKDVVFDNDFGQVVKRIVHFFSIKECS